MKVREFIKKIGGPILVARLLKLTRQAVAEWYKTGIPMCHAYTLAEKCAVSGVGFNDYTVKFISELEVEDKKQHKSVTNFNQLSLVLKDLFATKNVDFELHSIGVSLEGRDSKISIEVTTNNKKRHLSLKLSQEISVADAKDYIEGAKLPQEKEDQSLKTISLLIFSYIKV